MNEFTHIGVDPPFHRMVLLGLSPMRLSVKWSNLV